MCVCVCVCGGVVKVCVRVRMTVYTCNNLKICLIVYSHKYLSFIEHVIDFLP